MKNILFFFTILLVIVLLLFISLKYRHESFKNKNEVTFAIHAVFIAKENILFLEEWIDYHIKLGFNKFYLYDNSKVQLKNQYNSKNPHLKPGKVNKYNINYDEIVKLNQTQVNEIMNKIVKKYNGKVNIVEWSPKDKNGKVLFNQKEGHAHCLKRMKLEGVHWCANIDMDEFIVIDDDKTIGEFLATLDSKVSDVYLNQIRFQTRFLNMNKNIVDIDLAVKENGEFLIKSGAIKHIYKVKNTKALSVHTWNGNGKTILGKGIIFNHYKINDTNTDNFHNLKNINTSIKSHIHQSSKNYIKNEYI